MHQATHNPTVDLSSGAGTAGVSTLSAAWRRLLFMVPVAATLLAGAALLMDIIRANGVSLIEVGIFGLFLVTFCVITLSFWTALFGFLIRLLARDPVAFAAPVVRRQASRLTARTAVVMPIYNEDPERVCAGLEATYRSLRRTGELTRFSFFLLSDTTDLAIAREEKRLWQRLCHRLNARGRLHYRRREANIGRKVGNIADFCRRWGERFDYMVVLDADSVMAGTTLTRLARIMQANPRVGIVQTVPLPVHQETLFGRFLQFGSRLCSEMLCTGQTFWQLGNGNYYGHNAIIRIAPFMAHCELPVLAGKGPLAGEILSHDFVEAAWLARAGWQVWNLPDAYGSHEELPSNILDYAKRDRRWCQGNLQHLRLVTTPGLHPISRLHFILGAVAYLSSPIWLLLLTLGIAQLAEQVLSRHDYFLPYTLFPVWEVIKTTESISLLTLTIGMLLVPKILALALALCQPRQRLAYGGVGNLAASAVLEMIFAALIAPVLMIFHSMFVGSILCGRSIAWNPQRRGSRALGLLESLWYQKWQIVLGICIAAVIGAVAPQHFWWVCLLLAGLLLSVPMAVLTSRSDVGLFMARCELLLTPEERSPSVELDTVRRLTAAADSPAVRRRAISYA